MMIWSEKKDALLMQLWEQGVKTKEIGKRLGTSKGSVIGRHRRVLEKQGKLPVQPTPLIIWPAYDPIAKLWFVDKPKVEAGSISELIKKLPKHAVIKDYRKVA